MIRRTDSGREVRWRASGLLLAAFVFLAASCEATEDGPPIEGWVQIGTNRVALEIADTRAEQNLGLGERDSLAWDRGMYFPYRVPSVPSFWMKGMRFSIDIVWIRDGRIVDLHMEVPFVPGENGPTVRPRQVVDAVLEVPAGYARANGWRIGDRVQFERKADAP